MSTLHPLKAVYSSFCNRTSAATGSMDSPKFAKLARDCHVLAKGKVTSTDVDIVFTKTKRKGERRIDFEQFKGAVAELAKIRYPDKEPADAYASLEAHILSHSGPAFKGTKAKTGSGIYARLTDTSKYTGAHKERFDESGRGRGKEGRVDHDKVDDLSEITRPGFRSSADPFAEAEAREAHVRAQFNRFDKDGSGFLDHTEVAALLQAFGFTDADIAAEFSAADSNADGKIDFSEFTPLWNSLQARKAGEAPSASSVRRKPRAARVSDAAGAGAGASLPLADSPLQSVYLKFTQQGGNKYETEMDNVKWAKLNRDCRLIHPKKYSRTDCDLLFTKIKEKGHRKIQFFQFEMALSHIAAKLYSKSKMSPEDAKVEVIKRIVTHGPHAI